MEPKFKHDCDRCVLSGQDDKHDFYYCPSRGGQDLNVVVRYGDEEWQYRSVAASLLTQFEKEMRMYCFNTLLLKAYDLWRAACQ